MLCPIFRLGCRSLLLQVWGVNILPRLPYSNNLAGNKRGRALGSKQSQFSSFYFRSGVAHGLSRQVSDKVVPMYALCKSETVPMTSRADIGRSTHSTIWILLIKGKLAMYPSGIIIYSRLMHKLTLRRLMQI